MIEVALAMRGGMSGAGPLPFSGGYAEQPASVMARARVILAVDAKIEAERAKAGGR